MRLIGARLLLRRMPALLIPLIDGMRLRAPALGRPLASARRPRAGKSNFSTEGGVNWVVRCDHGLVLS